MKGEIYYLSNYKSKFTGEQIDKRRVLSVGGGDIEMEGYVAEKLEYIYPDSSYEAISETSWLISISAPWEMRVSRFATISDDGPIPKIS